MIEAILDFLGIVVMICIIGAAVAIWSIVSDKLNVTADNNPLNNIPVELKFNVQQRVTGAWVNRGTNLSENSAWHLAESLKYEGHPIQIKDSNGNLIASM